MTHGWSPFIATAGRAHSKVVSYTFLCGLCSVFWRGRPRGLPLQYTEHSTGFQFLYNHLCTFSVFYFRKTQIHGKNGICVLPKHRFDKSVFLCFVDDESSISFGCNRLFLNIRNCKTLKLSQLFQGKIEFWQLILLLKCVKREDMRSIGWNWI